MTSPPTGWSSPPCSRLSTRPLLHLRPYQSCRQRQCNTRARAPNDGAVRRAIHRSTPPGDDAAPHQRGRHETKRMTENAVTGNPGPPRDLSAETSTRSDL